MYAALKKDYPSFVPPPNKGGLLTPWADSGVLMLNTCLTVRAHQAFSHANRGWEKLTQKVIDLAAQKRTRGVVFMAWGTPAGKRVQKVDRSRHLVLQTVHPSPLSANRGPGFVNCGHFRKANEWLIERYGPEGEIDWSLTPSTSTKEAGGSAKKEQEEAVASPEATPQEDEKVETAVKVTVVAEDDIDSDEEAALEEAMKLAEAQTKA